MRQIKFRAWDVSRGKYRGGSDNLMLSLNGIKTWQFAYDPPIPVDQEMFILEQFIGLHDKNGVEIYEGDIVNIVGKDSIKPFYPFDAVVVEWDDDRAGFWPWTAASYQIDTGHSAQSKSEAIKIIGNIHETPELVK